MKRPHARTENAERGSVAIEAAIIAPAILVLLVLVIAAGRLAGAHSSIDNAASNAARAASISRDSGQARSDATTAAITTLTTDGSSCPNPAISVDTSGLAAPIGDVGIVRVQVSCVVPLSDLTGLPMGGSRTVTAEAESVVDAYRSRSSGFTNSEGAS